MCTLIPKLKNNMQSNTLNFLERVLFLLTIDEKVNRKDDLHYSEILGVDLHVVKSSGVKRM